MRTVAAKKRADKPKQVKEELQSEPVIYSRTALSAAHATHFYYYYSDFFSFLFSFIFLAGQVYLLPVELCPLFLPLSSAVC